MTNLKTYYCLSSREKYKRVIAAVHMVYRLVNSTYNTKELLIRLTRIICQLVGASSSRVHVLDEQTGKLKFIAIFNGRVNILLEKKSDFKKVSKDEKTVVRGGVVIRNRFIGLPLVSDENIGAVFMCRKRTELPFDDFDREVLSVLAEQVVTAVKNLQLHEMQQKVILDSIKSMGKFFEKYGPLNKSNHAPSYYNVVRCLAEELNMKEKDTRCLEYASILHDAGSVDVPCDILSKTSRLTPKEFKEIRKHPQKSVELIKPVAFLRPILPIVLYHHEWYNGMGYPSGLSGEDIPMGARVMAVADAFESMISARPYRKGKSLAEALKELQRQKGSQFDPVVVDAFCKIARQTKCKKYLSFMAR
ncbi:MAG: HD domain-containing protein [Candidatus Omnitrophica bacterium]|nr:HD domain-containing protein [Candidatus Omnitrophota bacterium]